MKKGALRPFVFSFPPKTERTDRQHYHPHPANQPRNQASAFIIPDLDLVRRNLVGVNAGGRYGFLVRRVNLAYSRLFERGLLLA